MHPEFDRLNRDYGWNILSYASNRQGIWVINKEVQGEIHYPDDGYAACFQVEENSFWFRHRNRVLRRYLFDGGRPKGFWEVGSGNGFVTKHIQDLGIPSVAVEPGHAGAANAVKRGVQASISGLLEELRLPDNSIPAIGCFDVLEHIEHPEILLKEIHRILQPGGKLVVSVPALQWLWSQADVDAGHFKRYKRDDLNTLLAQCGYEHAGSGYFMASMVAPLYWLRARPFRKNKNLSVSENQEKLSKELAPGFLYSAVASAMLSLEYLWSLLLPLPWGTSVGGVYRKEI